MKKISRKPIVPVSEFQHQIALVHWFRLKYPELYWNFFHIPMGELRSKAAGAKIKAMGAISGVADLFLSLPKYPYHGFWIELKSGSGKLSENQKVFLEAQEALGYKTGVYFGWEEASNAIDEYLIEWKVSVNGK